VVVDTVGHLLKVIVHPANIADRDGAWAVFEAMAGQFPRLQRIWADQGYTGDLADLVTFAYGWHLHIVPRHPHAGFKLLPRRWVVERTFAWLGGFRRLSRDYEQLPPVSAAWVYLSISRLMLHRLTS